MTSVDRRELAAVIDELPAEARTRMGAIVDRLEAEAQRQSMILERLEHAVVRIAATLGINADVDERPTLTAHEGAGETSKRHQPPLRLT